MGKLPKPKSDFGRPEDVENGEALPIAGAEGQYIMPLAKPDGYEKRFRLNETSYREIYYAYGSDDTHWLNQTVKVEKAAQKVRG